MTETAAVLWIVFAASASNVLIERNRFLTGFLSGVIFTCAAAATIFAIAGLP